MGEERRGKEEEDGGGEEAAHRGILYEREEKRTFLFCAGLSFLAVQRFDVDDNKCAAGIHVARIRRGT